MRKITKVKRSIRAISPVIATLLMIAIAVIASLVVYAWVTGYIGGTTTKASNSMLIQSVSHTAGGYIVIYVENVGQGTIQLKPAESTYINSVLKSITDSTPTISGGMVSFSPGTTASLTTDYTFTANEKLKIKITATDGTFAEYTTSGTSTTTTGTFTSGPTSKFTMSTSYPAIGQTVIFTDTSTAGSGTISSRTWSFGNGASPTTSTDPSQSVTYSSTGQRTVSLTVTDSNGKTSTTTKTITVGDYASPTASFTWNPLTPARNTLVTFTDTSLPGNGRITGWSWNFGDNSALGTTQNPTHTYTSDGKKTVTLIVTDINGKTSTTTRQVNVGNVVAPTAEFTISNSNPNVGETITFTDASTPVTGTPISQWSWDFGDGTTSSIQSPTHSYATFGIKTVTLTVTDSLSQTSKATHTVDVNVYTPPTASFNYTPTTITIGQTVTFTDASTAGSGSINQWSWNLGSDASPTSSTVQNPTASYSASGQKTVSLMVTDSNGKISTTTQTLTVNSPTPSGQVQLIIATPSSATAGTAFSATVTARDESGNLLTNYAGTLTFTSSDSQATLPAPSTLASGSGTFPITLKTAGSETITVTDGTVTSISGLITVNPTPASKLVYTVGASQSITINHVSSTITVQRQDQYSNPATSGAITVSFASTSGNGRFYSDSGGNNRITSAVTIPAGSSSYDFYYWDSSSGTPTLTASSSGLTSATTQFTVNNYQLAYTSTVPQTVPANQVSGAITIQSQDSSARARNPGGSGLTVTLTSSATTGTFYSDSAGTQAITTVTIRTSSPYTATFYYKDTAQGTPTLTATASGYTPATTTFIITGPATQLKFTAGTSQSIYNGQVSSVITVAQQDASGHAINAAAALPVDLAATSTTGTFFSNSQGTGTPITQITIVRGSNSANFYYKDTAAGSSTITASSTGLASATTTFTITLNLISDGGFDQSGNNSPWTSSGSAYATNHETSDTAPNNWGAYAELETVPPGYTGTGSSTLTHSLSPTIAISSIPSVTGSLSMMVYNTGYLQGTGYYSFQITLTANDGSQLIYWWGSNPATAPTQTGTVKVINLGTVQATFTAGQWIQFNSNLRADWTNAGLSTSASLTSIVLQDNGYHTGNSQYGQEIFIDNVAIR